MTRAAVHPSLIVLLLLACGCANGNLVAPTSLVVPAIGQPGEVFIGAQGGTAGAQLDTAWAIDDRLVARLDIQHASHQGAVFDVGRFGMGTWWTGAWAGSPSFGALWLDAGYGWAGNGGVEVIDGVDCTVTYEGQLRTLGLQAEAGLRWGYVEVAVAGQLEYISVRHGARSMAPDPSVSWLFGKPALVVRIGPPRIKAQVLIGTMIPMVGAGEIGEPGPWLVNGGLSLNL